MEQSKYESLIKPLEALAAKKPGQYRLRVALLAALGYLYLLIVVTLLLGIVVLVLFYTRINWLVIKILWIPLVLVGIVLHALWITLPVPDGTELQREQAPALFDLVHEVTTALNGPKVHHILLSGDFNAGIVQIPQFGMFGWQTNYLVVGLPMLRALNPAQFRAVLAHEVGHLSGKHGRFSGWIYRLRRSWVEVLVRVHQERHYASFLFEPFLNWYAPYLNAYSFVLARAQEYQADVYSVELAGKQTAAVTLARIEAKSRKLSEDFWPDFFRGSKEQPKAPRDPFAQMLGGLHQPIRPINAQRWFFESLQVPTGYEDTHPSLADRLAAMGFEKDSPAVDALLEQLVAAEKDGQSAESYYLRELPVDFLGHEDRLLREQLVQFWNESHSKYNEARRRLQKLNEQANERELTLEEQWEQLNLTRQVHNRDTAMPLLQKFLSKHPDHADAQMAMGAVLLQQHDPAGVEYLEKAMQLSPGVTGDVCAVLSGFYFEQGNKELAESFRNRAVEHYANAQKQQEQAMNFSGSDTLIPHDLAPEIVRNIQAQLGKVRGLSEAFLVRKVVAGMDPFYVLAVASSITLRNGKYAKHVGPLFEELSNLAVLPDPMVFLSLDGKHAHMREKITRIDSAQIYREAR
jgi:Zn-dependent protease with chaperone function